MNKLKTFYWKFFNKEKYNTYLTLCWIKDAKQYYLDKINDPLIINKPGMCNCFGNTVWKYPQTYDVYIGNIIPEFNREFLGGSDNAYWWHRNNTQARIEAFDKLIRIYEEKCAQ